MQGRLDKPHSFVWDSGVRSGASASASAATPGRLDSVFQEIAKLKISFGEFLVEAFTIPQAKVGDKPRTSTHSQMVSKFLGGLTKTHADQVVDLMYRSKDSHPKPVRGEPKRRPDERRMARWRLRQWALELVCEMIEEEASLLASVHGGLRLSDNITWDGLKDFSLASVMGSAQAKAPTLCAILSSVGIPKRDRLGQSAQHALQKAPQPTAAGTGHNRRDPNVIIFTTLLMLLNARNQQFTGFQKLVGVWLFGNGASHEIYAILGRMGLSVAYSTTLDLLRDLSTSTQLSLRHLALQHAFLLIYDNLNRMLRQWDPELGQKDCMDSGTAAMLVQLQDCDFNTSFDAERLENVRATNGRAKLTVDVLHRRIKWTELYQTMAVHVVSFLLQEVESLAPIKASLTERLRTTLAMHRMSPGRKSVVIPLATSNHDEGTSGGNQKVIDDLMLRQLGMSEEEASRFLTIIGGDQATVEKIRTLKRFLAECPHRYRRLAWVLPLIQLWHMGWADLERVLNTHWGPGHNTDPSTFAFMNELLGRKVKNVKRPDFYPAQALVVDTLRADILDSWRAVLDADDLDEYFASHPMAGTEDELINTAESIVTKYLSQQGYLRAQHLGDNTGFFPLAKTESTAAAASKYSAPAADHILANTILRMRDSMLHYEFQSAVSDGDIGRAMNIMAIWTFTFCGSGKSKYTNELLELACNFEFEYWDSLKVAIMNNWLCNPSGFEGCWFPMDLMMEHNIKELKTRSDQKKKEFGSTYFQNVIAYNIRHFLQVKEWMRDSTGLCKKSGAHRRRKKVIALSAIARAMREHNLHRYVPGRQSDKHAQDDFTKGDVMFTSTPRIQDFIQRTGFDEEDADFEMGSGADAENRQDNTEDREGTGDHEILPCIWADGVLVTPDDVAELSGGED